MLGRGSGCKTVLLSATFRQAYAETMRLLEALAGIFINTFGITQPTDAMRRNAAWFILGLMIVTLILVTIAGLVIAHVIRR